LSTCFWAAVSWAFTALYFSMIGSSWFHLASICASTSPGVGVACTTEPDTARMPKVAAALSARVVRARMVNGRLSRTAETATGGLLLFLPCAYRVS